MKRFTLILLCLFMVGIFAVKQTLGVEVSKTTKLKKYDELWALVQTEIATAKRWNQHLTVVAISRYNRKTVDAVIERLKADGYTIQTNSNKARLAMVVSWEKI